MRRLRGIAGPFASGTGGAWRYKEEERTEASESFSGSYNDEERCVCAGYDNGDVKLYDLRTNQIRWETNVRNGICCLDFDRKDIQMNKLVAATLESQFKLFDMRTYHPKEGYESLTEKAHKSTVWTCKHLPQNREIFMTGGGNGSINLCVTSSLFLAPLPSPIPLPLSYRHFNFGSHLPLSTSTLPSLFLHPLLVSLILSQLQIFLSGSTSHQGFGGT
mmetsp:Transcript_12737/g.44625  ORF Transcript_12737/g.44625 Transcript_12737/m.44625 type:complete len:218 (+) Transcript_12737:516-1169(+)